jgi:hypothetical protein
MSVPTIVNTFVDMFVCVGFIAVLKRLFRARPIYVGNIRLNNGDAR